jgi:hypothetical protein
MQTPTTLSAKEFFDALSKGERTKIMSLANGGAKHGPLKQATALGIVDGEPSPDHNSF